MSKEQQDKREHSASNGLVSLAIGLVVTGVIFLLNNFGLLPYNIRYLVISWPMLWIALGAWIIARKQKVAGTILVLIGSILMISRLADLYPEWGLDVWLLVSKGWPVFLILLGIYIYYNYKRSRNEVHFEEVVEPKPVVAAKKQLLAGVDASDTANPFSSNKADSNTSEEVASEAKKQAATAPTFASKTVTFATCSQQYSPQVLSGAKFRVTFGQLNLDLRKLSLQNNKAVIKLDNSFSTATLYIPSDWRVIINSQPLLGSITDRRAKPSSAETSSQTSSPLLILSGSCSFGSTEIRS